MAMTIATLRKLLALDEEDPLSRFALGKKLFEDGQSTEEWVEAQTHLQFANRVAPDHLATYNILAQTLIKLGKIQEAKSVLRDGIARASLVTEGMGRDLAPAMRTLLESLNG